MDVFRVLLFILLSISLIKYTHYTSDNMAQTISEDISIFSWNVRSNFNISKPYLELHASVCDLICISDHGLYECELHKLDNILDQYTGMGKSSKHLSNMNLGKKRGFGGCAILWKKVISNRVRPLPELGTDRICVVQINIDGHNYYVISVYLPHQTCKIDYFKDELNKLIQVCNECNANGTVIVLGDTNCHRGQNYP